MVKRVLLARPPVCVMDKMAITDTNFFFPPSGIALLSAILKQKGYDVYVADMYDDSWEKAEDFLIRDRFDVVGITCLSGQHFSALRLAAIAKKSGIPAPIVVLGGPHPSAEGIDTQILSRYPQIDFIVRQEGEITFPELLEFISSNKDFSQVPGITYRMNGFPVRTPDRGVIKDLDALPFPDYSFLDFNKTGNTNDGRIDISKNNKISRFVPIISSRGCPNRCQFCALFMGREVRFRSPENVIEEMEQLYFTKKIRHFTFVDDCFNASLPRAEKICQLIIDRKLKITWTAMARVKPLSEAFLCVAKESGCLALNFGVESGSKSILSSIGKNINLDDFALAVRLAKKFGINSAALFMVGNPGENRETIAQTIALIKCSRPERVFVSPLIVLPNSDLHALALKQKFIDNEFWLRNNNPPHYTAEHSLDELRFFRIKILFYHSFYLGNYTMALKLGLLMSGYRLIKLFNLQINDIRDIMLRVPLANSLIRKMRTV